MSGVRVNLLPREAEERERGRRALVGLAAGGLAFLAVLAGLYLLQLNRVGDAEEELRVAEERRARAQQEVDELASYADLEQRRDRSVELVQTLMATESTFAGILQDVAAVMPNDAALATLTVNIRTDEETTDPAFDVGPSFGTIAGSGETLRQHAPGVERFLLEFDKVAAFFNVFVTSSTLEPDTGVTVFNFEAELGPEVFTGRYLDGLPEGLR